MCSYSNKSASAVRYRCFLVETERIVTSVGCYNGNLISWGDIVYQYSDSCLWVTNVSVCSRSNDLNPREAVGPGEFPWPPSFQSSPRASSNAPLLPPNFPLNPLGLGPVYYLNSDLARFFSLAGGTADGSRMWDSQ
jgi:hypothetical protein